jgi:hypothetical protein
VVTAYRWGQRNAHSYVVGAFTDLESAKKCAHDHTEYRGGKYACEVCEASPWSEENDDSARQVFYVESPYYDMAGDSGHFLSADTNKRTHVSRKPFTVCELQNRISELERYQKRLEWLHDGGGKDADGFEWGVFRVKWSEQGQPEQVWQTLSDFSDLDREMYRESQAQTAHPGATKGEA